jgi:hypothetical protein
MRNYFFFRFSASANNNSMIRRTIRGGNQEVRAPHANRKALPVALNTKQKLQADYLPVRSAVEHSQPVPAPLAAGSPKPNAYRFLPAEPYACCWMTLPSRPAWHADRPKPRSPEKAGPVHIPGPASIAENSLCALRALPPLVATTNNLAAPAAATQD